MREVWDRWVEKARESFDRATVLRLAVIGILTVVCLFALDRMRRQSLSLERHLVRSEGVRVVAVPSWVNSQILTSVKASMPTALSIFSPDLFPRVYSAFASNPWVETLLEGSRVYPDKVEVALKLRRPIALARIDGPQPRYYLVDRDGARLPGYLAAPPENFPYPLPVLTGILGGPPDSSGGGFADPAVAHGARLALELYGWHNSDLYPDLEVLEIDLANLEGRRNPLESEVILKTNVQVPIHWGRARREMTVIGEASTAAKVEMVAKALRAYPSLGGVAAIKLHLGELLVELEEEGLATRG